MIPERVWQWYWPTNAKGMSGINVIAHEWGNHCSTVYEFFKPKVWFLSLFQNHYYMIIWKLSKTRIQMISCVFDDHLEHFYSKPYKHFNIGGLLLRFLSEIAKIVQSMIDFIDAAINLRYFANFIAFSIEFHEFLGWIFFSREQSRLL